MDIESTRADELLPLTQLLESAGLPTSDLTITSLVHFLSLRDGQRLVGAIGLDVVGEIALLRSLVVDSARRDRGLGGELVRAAEAHAAQHGVRQLYLLTTTADAFFASRGYVNADRENAPDAIRRMPQFAELCPASSTFMTKIL
jgi:amino-acid N-acetyltransferase